MIFRFGWKSFRQNSPIKGMIIILLMATFLIVIAAVSMLEIKLKKYMQVSDALVSRGRVILSAGLFDPETEYNLKDAEDLRQLLPNSDAVWSVTEVFKPCYGDDQDCNIWTYSEEVVNALSPAIADGRWFEEKDMESDILKTVVSYNDNQFCVGDLITVYEPDKGAEIILEVIGVLEDRASIFGYDQFGTEIADYRMLFSTYSYEVEDSVPLFILAEQQILGNQDKGWFEEFNYRLNREVGFIKYIEQCTVVRYPDSVSEEEIDADMQLLQKCSNIFDIYRIDDVRKDSKSYITKELYSTIPIVICILIYIVMATLSISAITVKSNLHNYATYYLCGMQWKQCSMISLAEAIIIAGTAFVFMLISMAALSFSNVFKGSALHLGGLQLLACILILFLYIFLAWLLPRNIVRKTSAREILKSS